MLKARTFWKKAYQETNLFRRHWEGCCRNFGERGLFVVEGMHTGLKQIANPLWQKVIASGSRLGEILASRTAELEQHGWPTPLRSTPDSYLFYVFRLGSHPHTLELRRMLRRPMAVSKKISCDDLVRKVESGELSISRKPPFVRSIRILCCPRLPMLPGRPNWNTMHSSVRSIASLALFRHLYSAHDCDPDRRQNLAIA